MKRFLSLLLMMLAVACFGFVGCADIYANIKIQVSETEIVLSTATDSEIGPKDYLIEIDIAGLSDANMVNKLYAEFHPVGVATVTNWQYSEKGDKAWATITAQADGKTKLYIKGQENSIRISSDAINITVIQPVEQITVNANVFIGVPIGGEVNLQETGILGFFPSTTSQTEVTYSVSKVGTENSIANFKIEGNVLKALSGAKSGLIEIKAQSTEASGATDTKLIKTFQVMVYTPIDESNIEFFVNDNDGIKAIDDVLLTLNADKNRLAFSVRVGQWQGGDFNGVSDTISITLAENSKTFRNVSRIVQGENAGSFVIDALESGDSSVTVCVNIVDSSGNVYFTVTRDLDIKVVSVVETMSVSSDGITKIFKKEDTERTTTLGVFAQDKYAYGVLGTEFMLGLGPREANEQTFRMELVEINEATNNLESLKNSIFFKTADGTRVQFNSVDGKLLTQTIHGGTPLFVSFVGEEITSGFKIKFIANSQDSRLPTVSINIDFLVSTSVEKITAPEDMVIAVGKSGVAVFTTEAAGVLNSRFNISLNNTSIAEFTETATALVFNILAKKQGSTTMEVKERGTGISANFIIKVVEPMESATARIEGTGTTEIVRDENNILSEAWIDRSTKTKRDFTIYLDKDPIGATLENVEIDGVPAGFVYTYNKNNSSILMQAPNSDNNFDINITLSFWKEQQDGSVVVATQELSFKIHLFQPITGLSLDKYKVINHQEISVYDGNSLAMDYQGILNKINLSAYVLPSSATAIYENAEIIWSYLGLDDDKFLEASSLTGSSISLLASLPYPESIVGEGGYNNSSQTIILNGQITDKDGTTHSISCTIIIVRANQIASISVKNYDTSLGFYLETGGSANASNTSLNIEPQIWGPNALSENMALSYVLFSQNGENRVFYTDNDNAPLVMTKNAGIVSFKANPKWTQSFEDKYTVRILPSSMLNVKKEDDEDLWLKLFNNASVYYDVTIKIGDGSQTRPYRIYTEDDLKDIAVKGLDKNYVLMHDIVLSNEWTPIAGTFTGSLRSMEYQEGVVVSYTIFGLEINEIFEGYVGLFERLGTNAVIKNLRIETSGINISTNTVDGNLFVGILAGSSASLHINNVAVYTAENKEINITITGINANATLYAGGLVGENTGTINGCFVQVDLVVESKIVGYVGGVAGLNSTGSVLSNCEVRGNIVAMSSIVGGVAGENRGSLSQVTSSAKVFGGDYVGGIAGKNSGNIQFATVEFYGELDGSATVGVSGENYVGGLVGSSTGGLIQYSFVVSYITHTQIFRSETLGAGEFYGDILGASFVGGLIGSSVNTNIPSCFARVKIGVSGELPDNIGGLIGYFETDNTNFGVTGAYAITDILIEVTNELGTYANTYGGLIGCVSVGGSVNASDIISTTYSVLGSGLGMRLVNETEANETSRNNFIGTRNSSSGSSGYITESSYFAGSSAFGSFGAFHLTLEQMQGNADAYGVWRAGGTWVSYDDSSAFNDGLPILKVQETGEWLFNKEVTNLDLVIKNKIESNISILPTMFKVEDDKLVVVLDNLGINKTLGLSDLISVFSNLDGSTGTVRLSITSSDSAIVAVRQNSAGWNDSVLTFKKSGTVEITIASRQNPNVKITFQICVIGGFSAFSMSYNGADIENGQNLQVYMNSANNIVTSLTRDLIYDNNIGVQYEIGDPTVAEFSDNEWVGNTVNILVGDGSGHILEGEEKSLDPTNMSAVLYANLTFFEEDGSPLSTLYTFNNTKLNFAIRVFNGVTGAKLSSTSAVMENKGSVEFSLTIFTDSVEEVESALAEFCNLQISSDIPLSNDEITALNLTPAITKIEAIGNSIVITYLAQFAEIRLEQDFVAYYDFTIKDEIGNNISTLRKTITWQPSKIQRLDIKHYLGLTGYSEETSTASNEIATGRSGVLKLTVTPEFGDIDYLLISSTTAQGDSISFDLRTLNNGILERVATSLEYTATGALKVKISDLGGYEPDFNGEVEGNGYTININDKTVAVTNGIYEGTYIISDNKVMIGGISYYYNSRTNTIFEFDGVVYLSTLLASGLPEGTKYTVTVQGYKDNGKGYSASSTIIDGVTTVTVQVGSESHTVVSGVVNIGGVEYNYNSTTGKLADFNGVEPDFNGADPLRGQGALELTTMFAPYVNMKVENPIGVTGNVVARGTVAKIKVTGVAKNSNISFSFSGNVVNGENNINITTQQCVMFGEGDYNTESGYRFQSGERQTVDKYIYLYIGINASQDEAITLTATITSTAALGGVDVSTKTINLYIVDYIVESISLQGWSGNANSFAIQDGYIPLQIKLNTTLEEDVTKAYAKAEEYLTILDKTAFDKAFEDSHEALLAKIIAQEEALNSFGTMGSDYKAIWYSGLSTGGGVQLNTTTPFANFMLQDVTEKGESYFKIKGKNVVENLPFYAYFASYYKFNDGVYEAQYKNSLAGAAEDPLTNSEREILLDFTISFKNKASIESPDPITNAEQLQNMVAGGHYILMEDIDLNEWTPLTTQIGSLDGNGYVINLKSIKPSLYNGTTRKTTVNAGLFDRIGTFIDDDGKAQATLLKNIIVDVSYLTFVNLSDASIQNVNFGFIAGVSDGGIIYNCEVVAQERAGDWLQRYNSSSKDLSITIESFAQSTFEQLEIEVNEAIANNDSVKQTIVSTFIATSGTATVISGGIVGQNNGYISNSRVGRVTNSLGRGLDRNIKTYTVENGTVRIDGVNYTYDTDSQKISVGGVEPDFNGNVAGKGYTVSTAGSTPTVTVQWAQGTVAGINLFSTGTLGGIAGTNSGVIGSSYFANGNLINSASSTMGTVTGGLVGVNTGSISASYSEGITASIKAGSLISDNKPATGAGSSEGTGEEGEGTEEEGEEPANTPSKDGVGRVTLGTIFSIGTVGGFVHTNDGIVENCYSNMIIASQSGVGGFVYNNAKEASVIEDCYSVSTVLTFNAFNGAFTGLSKELNVNNTGTIENCYFLQNEDFIVHADEPATRLVYDKFATESRDFFIGFVFSTNSSEFTWKNDDKIGIAPRLVQAEKIATSFRDLDSGELTESVIKSYSYSSATYIGKEANPALIYNSASFDDLFGEQEKDKDGKIILGNYGQYVRVIADIDFLGLSPTHSTSAIFSGNLQGNGMTIKQFGLQNNVAGVDYIGLFAQVQGTTAENSNTKKATIANLNIQITKVIGTQTYAVGALAGKIDDSNIENIKILAKDTNSMVTAYNIAGGLAGVVSSQTSLYNIKSKVSVYTVYDIPTENNYAYYQKSTTLQRNISYSGGVAGVLTTSDSYSNNASKAPVINNMVTGVVEISGHIVGGVFGLVDTNAIVSRIRFIVISSPDQKLNGLSVAGGLVGENRGVITRSYIGLDVLPQQIQDQALRDDGNAEAHQGRQNLFVGNSNVIGGLVGFNRASCDENGDSLNGLIEYSYSRVSVANTSAKVVGGIVGLAVDNEFFAETYTLSFDTASSENRVTIGEVEYLYNAGKLEPDFNGAESGMGYTVNDSKVTIGEKEYTLSIENRVTIEGVQYVAYSSGSGLSKLEPDFNGETSGRGYSVLDNVVTLKVINLKEIATMESTRTIELISKTVENGTKKSFGGAETDPTFYNSAAYLNNIYTTSSVTAKDIAGGLVGLTFGPLNTVAVNDLGTALAVLPHKVTVPSGGIAGTVLGKALYTTTNNSNKLALFSLLDTDFSTAGGVLVAAVSGTSSLVGNYINSAVQEFRRPETNNIALDDVASNSSTYKTVFLQFDDTSGTWDFDWEPNNELTDKIFPQIKLGAVTTTIEIKTGQEFLDNILAGKGGKFQIVNDLEFDFSDATIRAKFPLAKSENRTISGQISGFATGGEGKSKGDPITITVTNIPANDYAFNSFFGYVSSLVLSNINFVFISQSNADIKADITDANFGLLANQAQNSIFTNVSVSSGNQDDDKNPLNLTIIPDNKKAVGVFVGQSSNCTFEEISVDGIEFKNGDYEIPKDGEANTVYNAYFGGVFGLGLGNNSALAIKELNWKVDLTTQTSSGNIAIGGIAGFNQTQATFGKKNEIFSTLGNIDIKLVAKNSSSVYVGGVLGYSNSNNCDISGLKIASFNADITTENTAPKVYMGGLVGTVTEARIQNVNINSSLKFSGTATPIYAGGLVGKLTASASRNAKTVVKAVSNAVVSTDIEIASTTANASVYAGGLVGDMQTLISNNGTQPTGTPLYDQNLASGSITVSSSVGGENAAYVGGLFGNAKCNEGVETGTETVENIFTLRNSASDVDIKVSGFNTGYVGGINGYNSLYIENCISYGLLSFTAANDSATVNMGGIVGRTSNTIEKCLSVGLITTNNNGTRNVNAVVGLFESTVGAKVTTSNVANNSYYCLDLTGAVQKDETVKTNVVSLDTLLSGGMGSNIKWTFNKGGEGNWLPVVTALSEVMKESANIKLQKVATWDEVLYAMADSDSSRKSVLLTADMAPTTDLSNDLTNIGRLLGNGHTITLPNGTSESVFDNIPADTLVSGLVISGTEIAVGSGVYGALARTNNGVITKCVVGYLPKVDASYLGGAKTLAGISNDLDNQDPLKNRDPATERETLRTTVTLGTSDSATVGALVGINTGTINNTWSYADIIIYNSSTSDQNCYFGGLVGENKADTDNERTGLIEYAYTLGKLHINKMGTGFYLGGVIGYDTGKTAQLLGMKDVTVDDINGEGNDQKIGGVTGYSTRINKTDENSPGIIYTNDFNTYGGSWNDFGISKSFVNLKSSSFGLNSLWVQNSGSSYGLPYLALGLNVIKAVKEIEGENTIIEVSIISTGTGTKADPYQIHNPVQLTDFVKKGNKDYFILTRNLEVFKSYGSGTLGGTLNGGGRIITMKFNAIESTVTTYALFNASLSGRLDYILLNVDFDFNTTGTTGVSIAPLLTKNDKGTVMNCAAFGTITVENNQTSTHVSGLVGELLSGTISQCWSSVDITVTVGTVGGLVGRMSGGTLNQSFAEGTLKVTGATGYIGGLIGELSKTSIAVHECYYFAKNPNELSLKGGAGIAVGVFIGNVSASGTLSESQIGRNFGYSGAVSLQSEISNSFGACSATINGSATGGKLQYAVVLSGNDNNYTRNDTLERVQNAISMAGVLGWQSDATDFWNNPTNKVPYLTKTTPADKRH